MHRLLLAPLVILLGPALWAHAQQTPVQVGLFETEVPAASEFILRGTLPLPVGTFFPDNLSGASLAQRFPVVLLDSDGRWIVPQIETVSRYPNASQGAAVIELVARVTRPTNSQVGDLVGYRIFKSEGLPLNALAPNYDPLSPKFSWLNFDSDVSQLLTLPGSLLLRARDARGNFYASKLLPQQNQQAGKAEKSLINKAGHIQLELQHNSTLLPVLESVPGTLLPHHFGVHAILGFHDRMRYVTLDLRLHNGHSSLDPTTTADDALGKLYFQELEILTPPGWKVLRLHEDLHAAESYPTGLFWHAHPIFNPAPGSGLHVIAPQGQLHRRFVLVPPSGATNSQIGMQHGQKYGLAFCQPGINNSGDRFWSWWNPLTANYMTQNSALPGFGFIGKTAVRSLLSQDYANLAAKLKTGTSGAPPLTSGAVGWMHPYGQAYGGISGGIDIHFFEGVPTAWAASRSGYLRQELVHRMQSDRQRNVAYDADGTPTTLAEKLVAGPGGPYFPGKIYLTTLANSDPFGQLAAPTSQADWVASQGLKPAYEADLLSFEAIDMQHLIRYTRSAKTLAWLANDSLAKQDLFMQAALVHMSYHQYPNEASGFTTPTNLLSDMQFVQQNPGIGFDFNRGEGWMTDTMAATYALSPPSWRLSNLAWFRQVARLVFDGQAVCSGFLQAAVNSKVLDGKYRTRQNYEEAIVQNGLWGVLATTLAGTGLVEEQLLRTVIIANIGGMISPLAWDESKQAPFQQIAVGPLDVSQPLFCTSVPWDGFAPGDWDTYQCWNSFAYAFRLSFDPLFLIAPALMVNSWDLKFELESDGLANIENRAALLGLLQWNGQ
jgi:hypothetical protein